MKTKILIGIIGAMLMPGITAEAQIASSGNYRNDEAGIVINNYYNYDFHYSSRINRFHRSFVSFEYYSPVFTDVYWYSYQPYTWGLTIYGGTRIGIGVTYNYPVYYAWWDYPWSYGWDYAWYGGSFYWGYTPFYVTWYTPVVVNVRVNRWWPGTYYAYHVRNLWYGDYRPVYNTYNYYYYNTSGRYDAGSGGVSRRVSPTTTSSQTVNTGRGAGTLPSPGNQGNTGTVNQNRRNVNARVHQGDQGNNNSLDPGNTNNVNRGINSGNNPGRRNVPSNNGNVHQGDKGNNNSLNPGNTGNVNRGINSGNNPGRKNVSNQGNQSQGNAGRAVISTPSNSRVQSGVMTPSRPGATGNTSRPASVSTGRTVTQPAVSQGTRRTVSTSPAVRSSGGESRSTRAIRSVSSGSTKSSGSKSEESKGNSNSSSSRRR